MAFLPLIPQPTDQLSVSQGNILNNFTILGAIAGNANIGSTALNSVAGFNSINLALQGGTVPSFNGNNGFWAGNFAHDATTTVETWAQYNQGVGGTLGQYQYPISASILSLFPTNTAPVNGWSYLASGILMKWGTASCPGGITNIALNAVGPNFTKAFVAQLTVQTGGAGTIARVSSLNATQLQVVPDASCNVYWFVIGF